MIKNNEKLKEYVKYFWRDEEKNLSAILTIENMFSELREFEVPEFQRNYVWSADYALRLIKDAIEHYNNKNDNDNLFLGAAILKGGQQSSYKIIDGQQRLSTIALTLLILRDICEKSINMSLADKEEIDRKISNLIIRDTDKEFKIVLRMDNEKEDINSILSGEIKKIKNKNIESLVKNLNNLEEKIGIKLDTFEDFNNVIDSLISAELSVIKLSKKVENEYFAFESINSKGIPLRTGHLIRNYLFSLKSKISNEIDDDKFMGRFKNLTKQIDVLTSMKESDELKIWKSQFYSFFDIENWNEYVHFDKRRVNRFPKTSFEIANLIKYSIEKNFADPLEKIKALEKVVISDKILKDEISRLERSFSTEEFAPLKVKIKYVYNAYQYRTHMIRWLNENNYISYENHNISYSNNKRVSENETTFKLFDILTKLNILFWVANMKHDELFKSYKAYFNVFDNFLKSTTFDELKLSEEILKLYNEAQAKINMTKDKFSENLSKMNFYRFISNKFILKTIENKYSSKIIWPFSTGSTKRGNKILTLEHIHAQNLVKKDQKNVSKYFGVNWDEFSATYLNTLGNLTLEHDTFGNLPFEDKVEKYDKGIHIHKGLKAIKVFDLKEYDKRTNLLVVDILNEFSFY